MSESAFKRGKAEAAAAGAENPVEVLFMKALKSMPGVDALVSQGKLVSEFRTAGDYSYGATRYSGPNFRVVGDAGGECFGTNRAKNRLLTHYCRL